MVSVGEELCCFLFFTAIADFDDKPAPGSSAGKGGETTQATRSKGAAERMVAFSSNSPCAAREVNDESSASIKRSLAMAHQTNQVAADTMLELDKQGRQIERMERDVETIEDNNRQAERHLRGLKTIFGSIANKFSKNKSYREESIVVPRGTTDTVKQQGVASRSASAPASSGGKSGQVKGSQLLQGEDEETQQMRRQMDEQDEDLDQLSGALHNMMNMATDMNREITDQNGRLEKVSAGVDKQNKTIEKHNRQVKKML